jgi:hypothetical protein
LSSRLGCRRISRMAELPMCRHTDKARRRTKAFRSTPSQRRSGQLLTPFGQKTHLTALSCGLLMIITQEPAQSLAALDAPLSIEVTVPRK